MSIRVFRHLLLSIIAVTLMTLMVTPGVFAQTTDPTVVIASGYVLPIGACHIDTGVTKTFCNAFVVSTRFIPRSQALAKYKDYVVLPPKNASRDALFTTDRQISALKDTQAKALRATLLHLTQKKEPVATTMKLSCQGSHKQSVDWRPFNGTGGAAINTVSYTTDCATNYWLSLDTMSVYNEPDQPTYWCWDAYASDTFYASPNAWYMREARNNTIYDINGRGGKEHIGYEYTVTVGQIGFLGNYCVGGLFPTPTDTAYMTLSHS